MLSYKDAAAEIMEHLCRHDGNAGHGYSQPNRQGIGTGGAPSEEITLSDGTKVKIAYGDRDCSSAVIECYAALGVNCGGASYTGNMRSCMTKTGNFRWEPMGNGYIAKRGDIYLNEKHHTAMCTNDNPDTLAQFSISEKGTTYGTRGDQTGYESNIKAYYNYPWDGKLVYCGPARAGASAPTKPVVVQFPGQPVNDCGLNYRAHVKDYGWLDAVRDGQTAGTVGLGLQLEAIKVTPPDGLKLTAKIHVADKGWIDYEGIEKGASSGEGSSKNDPIIGTTGEGLRAEAIEFDVVENTTGRTLMYQVHVADEGWTGWVTAGHATGSVGMKKQIEAIQMKLV